MNHPDPIKHRNISLVKSGLRIVAGGNLAVGNFLAAGALFIAAEFLGIWEELV
jgi:hypothetical protein